MHKKCNDHIRPSFVILRRSGIAFPVKDRLRSARKLFRHKAQLQIRTDAELHVAVDDPVDIGVVVLNLHLAVFLIFLIYGHVVRKKSVPSDKGKAYLFLYKCQFLKVLLRERKPQASRADAIVHVVVERYFVVWIGLDRFCSHFSKTPFKI